MTWAVIPSLVVNNTSKLYFIFQPGREELVEKLLQDEKIMKNKRGKEGIEDMKLLLKYCKVFGVTNKVILTRPFEISLMLCYYTVL